MESGAVVAEREDLRIVEGALDTPGGRDPFDFSDIPEPRTERMPAGGKIAIEQLVGGVSPFPGHPELYYRKPKLRQRLEMQADMEGVDVATMRTLDQANTFVGLMSRFCFIREEGEYRPATKDDVLDIVDDEQEFFELVKALGFAQATTVPNG